MKKALIICLASLGLVAFVAGERQVLASVPCVQIDGICIPQRPSPPTGSGEGPAASAPTPNSGVFNPPNVNYPFGNPMGSAYQGTTPPSITPFFVVGNAPGNSSQSNSGFNGTANVYIYGTPGDKVSFSIKNATPACQDVGDMNGAYGGPDFGNGSNEHGPDTTFSLNNGAIELGPNNNVTWTSGGHSVDNGKARIVYGSDGCGSVSFTFKFSVSSNGKNAQPVVDPRTGHAIVDGDGLPVYQIVLQATASTAGSSPVGENSFRLEGAHGLSGVSAGLTGYGFRDAAPLPYGGNWTAKQWTSQITFTVNAECSDLNTPVTISNPIFYGDLDVHDKINNNWVNYPYGDSNMELLLQSRPLDQPGSWDNEVGPIVPNPNGSTPNYGYFPSMKFSPSRLYRLVLKNFGTENTVFVKLDSQLSALGAALNPTEDSCADFSCTATPLDADTVRVVLTNQAKDYAWGKGYQVRERDSGGNPISVGGVNQVWPKGGFSTNIQPGDSRTSTDAGFFARPPNADVHFVLYDDTGSNANMIHFDPDVPCGTSSTSGGVSVDCQNVTVHDIKGETVTYDNNGTQTKATQIPAKLELTGQGIDQTVYEWIRPINSSGNQTTDNKFDTFSTFNKAWPHVGGYTITLSYVTSGDLSSSDYSNGDPFKAYSESGNKLSSPQNATLGTVCLQAVSCTASVSPVDMEPGQDVTYKFVVGFNNQTGDSFNTDARKYTFESSTSAGAVLVGNNTQTPVIPPGNVSYATASYDGYFNYSGGYFAEVVAGSDRSVLIACDGNSTPQTRPYFVYHQGDFFTGGGFYSGATCTQTTPYPSDTDTSLGGIKAYANIAAGAGSHGDYAVDSLGQIYGNINNGYGFYSTADRSRGILFADKTTGGATAPLGGYLNSDAPAHCAPDFYGKYQGATTPLNNKHINNVASGRYFQDGDLNINYNVQSFTGQVTIFVNGDVTIKNDITYAATFNPADPSNIPFLAIVAKGNITLSGNVQTLDGLYIAQPDSSGNKGIFATCDNTENGISCARQLTVNGAVIAQKYDLLRGHGTVGPQVRGYSGKVGSDPAEIFNYVPSMVMGMPNFNWPSSNLNGLYNLPPVF